MFDGKVVLITGGTGSLGTALTKKILETNVTTIRIFSRDEWKQVQMESKFNDERLRFFIGDTKFWNMTSALESFKLLLEYSFKKLNLHKVTAGANVENKNSWKIIERIGFVKEGTIRDTIYRNGKYYDAYFYSILRNEYQKIYDSKSK